MITLPFTPHVKFNSLNSVPGSPGQDPIAFNDAYRDTKEGDQYDIVHISEQDLKLFFNGKEISSHDNDDFATQYFKIWFGNKPFNKSLKQNLL